MKNILLVEPNQSVAGIIQEFLESHLDRVKVFPAFSAQDAIHIADKNLPDLVILELALPSQNGFAFLHEFRSYPDWQEVPVIIHSHLAKEEASMSKAWDTLGAVEYFYKPATNLRTLTIATKEALLK